MPGTIVNNVYVFPHLCLKTKLFFIHKKMELQRLLRRACSKLRMERREVSLNVRVWRQLPGSEACGQQ